MMEESAPGKFKFMAIGGVIGGVLSSIPCLSALNCCFCLLIGVGSYLAVKLWLDADASTKLTMGDAAMLGAGSGAIAGVITAVLGALMSLITGPMQQEMMMELFQELDVDPQLLAMVDQTGSGAMAGLCIGLIVSPLLYGLFGALWAIAGASLMHKDRME